MPRKTRPLVEFSTDYYKYPTVSPGLWVIEPNEFESPKWEQQIHEEWFMEIPKWFRTDFHKLISEVFSDPSDDQIFHSLLTRHGIFTEKFFHKAIRERVTRQFAQVQIDLQAFQGLLSLASSSIRGYEHKWHLYGKWDVIYRIIDHIFKQAAYRALSTSQGQCQLKVWFEQFRLPRVCTLCDNEFRVIDLPEWVYFGSNGFQSCCFRCPVEAPKKRELEDLIPKFVAACGFIPASNASPINYAFTSRLSSNQWPKALLAYTKMGGIDYVKRKFSSWLKALAETGTLPDGVLATARGIRCLAQDGHVCHSLDEQRIDNWLSVHNLPHEREPRYPAHLTLNPTGRRRADWKVRETFIEYFGLIGDPNYEKKMGEKILLAKHLEINLIAIYPQDIENLDQRLGCLLENAPG